MEIKVYNRKPKQVEAVKYDGSFEMALEIEKLPNFRGYVEYDESVQFCGLQAFTEWGDENSKSAYAEEGDYLVFNGEFWELIYGYNFEAEYETN